MDDSRVLVWTKDLKDLTEVEQKVRLSLNRIGAPTDKRSLRVAQPSRRHPPKRRTAPQTGAVIANFGAGNEIRTHDFNLGNIFLAPNTIREIQQHQPYSVPWRCVPSRGVPWKVEG
jgi:hypothetical protein